MIEPGFHEDGGGYRPHVLLELRILRNGQWTGAPHGRLKLALKNLLRAYGLRCVAMDTISGRSLLPAPQPVEELSEK